MSTDAAIQELREALAGNSDREKLAAVLALPEDAAEAVGDLEAAQAGASPLLEVALLDALYRIRQVPEVKRQLEEILNAHEDEGDESEEIYMMARIAFNRVEGDETDPFEAEGPQLVLYGAPVVTGPDKLAVVVHGTWASKGTWWRKGSDFYDYLIDSCGLGYLYSGDEPFIWSGRNRDSARHEAALAFGAWIANHDPKHLEVYAHSHGANVAMRSTQHGLPIQKLVMLSPPVRSDYFARWEKVGEAYNVQAKFDPVVGIARGGQKFNLPGIVEEITLDAYSHSASHDHQVWERELLPEKLGLRPAGN